MIKYLILLIPALCFAHYVEYGDFANTDKTWWERYWQEEVNFYPIVEEWGAIHNVHPAVVDGVYYEPCEFSVPEPSTMALLAAGIVLIRKRK